MKQRLRFHLDFVNDQFDRELVIWGNGAVATKVATELKNSNIDFSFSVSNDYPQKQSFFNKPVKPKTILSPSSFYIIIASIHYEEIEKELKEFGYVEKIDYYCWKKEALNYDVLWDNIRIGRYSYGYQTWQHTLGVQIKLDDFVESIGSFVSINGTSQINGDHSMKHLSMGILSFIDSAEKRKLYERYSETCVKWNRVKIGNDVWIGANSFINASKVKQIGDGAVIGAGAVVLHDVPPYAIVAGVPAKIINYRFTESQIEILEHIKWWDWDEEKLREHAECFYNTELFFEKYSQSS